MLEVRPLGLDGVVEIIPRKFGDERGFFSETYNAAAFGQAGIELSFVQDNHSYSAAAGVVRGLHYQLPPFAQDKLLRVVRGRLFDVAVDIRRSSPDFGKWVGIEISAKKWNQILIPKGFAHGFMTLEPDTEVIYKVSALYSAAHDRGIKFDDPAIGIKWPMNTGNATVSAKDAAAPLLSDADTFE
jgi:dTDP-4-dehydrorhamnose 3,5-epimerase